MTAPQRRSVIGRGPAIRLSRADADAGTPLHRQLYLQLRHRIESGGLLPGEPVPSSRTLSRELRVSRNTVEAALLALQAEGFLVRRVGSGTVVNRRGA